MSFNLLDEEFIPVLWSDGRTSRVGVRAALVDAGRIRQIAASNPMDNVALMRFLVAVLYWCKGNPPSQEELSQLANTGRFPAEWFAKLNEQQESFDLLGEGKRFYQRRGLAQSDKNKLTANYLMHEVPSGTNSWHFRHATDHEDGLCPGCCAVGLIRLPMFATSGGRGKSPGVNAKPPVYIVPLGQSLLESLLLNWIPVSDIGIPAWDDPGMALPCTGSVSLLAGLTWTPRRVWLDAPESPAGPCICCGRYEPVLIRDCVFAGIGSTKSDDDTPPRNWVDPHVIYTRDKAGVVTSAHARDALGSPDAAANQWLRLLSNILAAESGGSVALRHALGTLKGRSGDLCVSIVGFSTIQSDKYLEAWEKRVALPTDPASPGPFAVETLRQWQKESLRLLARLKPDQAKQSIRRHAELACAMNSIRSHVEMQVWGSIDDPLGPPGQTWERAVAEYRQMMPVIATSLAPGFTPSALQRQNQIASTVPDMAQEREDKAPRRKTKKGGDR